MTASQQKIKNKLLCGKFTKKNTGGGEIFAHYPLSDSDCKTMLLMIVKYLEFLQTLPSQQSNLPGKQVYYLEG